jgi:tripartite-type tricarboxylate transporter receptor subunit TctC
MSGMRRRSLLQGTVLWAATAAAGARARAQSGAGSYPDHTVRVVLPFAPGGAIDQMARVASQMLTRRLGQSFVVEIKPGAGGVLGTSTVVHAPADGYTLLAASASAITIAPLMLDRMPYDPEKDLRPIVMLGDSPIAVVVRRESPLRTLADLIASAKAAPGKLSFGSAGTGSAAHLGGELFKWRAGVDLLHVPYRGVSLAEIDLLAGRLDVMFVNYSVVHPAVQAGTLRVLAIAAEQRLPAQPQFPTAAELGVSGYVVGNWNGLMAPANTPRGIIDLLNRIVVEGFRDPALLSRMADMGMDPVTGSPDAFAQHIRQEITQMKALLAAANIKPE